MKKVAHPNCVLLHEVYDESNKTYMVLDLITGGTVMVCMCLLHPCHVFPYASLFLLLYPCISPCVIAVYLGRRTAS
jgi:hypothetical protein